MQVSRVRRAELWLRTLDAAEIVAINLNPTDAGGAPLSDGTHLQGISSYVDHDGETHDVGDVVVTFEAARLQRGVSKMVEQMASFEPTPAGSTNLPDNKKTTSTLTIFGPSA